MSSRTRGWLIALIGTMLVATFVMTCTPFVKLGRPAPWELAHQPSADATRIDIVVLGGGCGADDERLGDVSVDELPQRVVITAAIRKPVAVGAGACPSVLRLHPATVELRAPLGRRTLVDGRTGQPPPAPY